MCLRQEESATFLHPAGAFASAVTGPGAAEEVGPVCLESGRIPSCLSKATDLTTLRALPRATALLPCVWQVFGQLARPRFCWWVTLSAVDVSGIRSH